MLLCKICGEILTGKQTKFCSMKCANKKFTGNYNWRKARSLKLKERLVEQKGGKCERCGYDKNYAALCFHHVDPFSKNFNLDARTIGGTAIDIVLQEAEKCILLCHNCHAEEHNPEKFKTNYLNIIEALKREPLVVRPKPEPKPHKKPGPKPKPKQPHLCSLCNAENDYRSDLCNLCFNKNRKSKIEWPSDQKLLYMLASNSRRAVSLKLGVSDNAIKKRLKYTE